MATCSRCSGEGSESYDEDNRMVTDTCYHCSGSGKVEPEVDMQDRFMKVACAIAYQAESDYRKDCDNDPDGEGYAFCAAEHMLSSNDYFTNRVYERQYKIAELLSGLNVDIQKFLLKLTQ